MAGPLIPWALWPWTYFRPVTAAIKKFPTFLQQWEKGWYGRKLLVKPLEFQSKISTKSLKNTGVPFFHLTKKVKDFNWLYGRAAT